MKNMFIYSSCNQAAKIQAAAILLAMVLSVSPRANAVNVLTGMNDNHRTGANTRETILTTTNVNVKQFGKLWSYSVDGAVYAQPLYVSGLSIAGGKHDVLFVATMEDSVYAFDADTNATFWHVNFTGGGITPVPIADITGNNNLNIVGDVGIESAPVIDLKSGTIYLLARTMDTTTGAYLQKLHALDLATGAEKFGGPVTVDVAGFDPKMGNQRAGLALANGNIIIAWASHEDMGPYHGWVMAYDARTLKLVSAFNDTATGGEGGIWQQGRAPAVDSSGNVYLISGNGSWDGKTNFGESFLKFSSNLKLLDWFTPYNWLELNEHDYDLGATGPMLIPGTDLVVGGGKRGILYVCKTGNLGHIQPGNTQIVQSLQMATGQLRGGTVYWKSAKLGPLIYNWSSKDYLKAFHFNGSTIDPTPVAQSSILSPGLPGAFLSISANGGKPGSGIVWATMAKDKNDDHGVVAGIVRAFNAENVAVELWNSDQNPDRDDMGNFVKDANPTIANGKVYIGSYSDIVSVYGLLDGGNHKPAGAAPQN